MNEALTLDVGAVTWQSRTRSDSAALALARDHYSRKSPDSQVLGPPGAVLCFVTPCERAVWMTHYPLAQFALDKIDAYRCSMFRNTGAGQSSDLIRAAVQADRATMGTTAARRVAYLCSARPSRVRQPWLLFQTGRMGARPRMVAARHDPTEAQPVNDDDPRWLGAAMIVAVLVVAIILTLVFAR